MSICPSLAPIVRESVNFDVTNPEHLKAYKMLCIGEIKNGVSLIRQHPTLRFNLEHPFTNVRTMMQHKVGEHYVNTFCKN